MAFGREDNAPVLVEYNLSNTKIVHIGNLIIQADGTYLRGNISKSFEIWTRICRHIRSRFTKKEYKYGLRLEKAFRLNNERAYTKSVRSNNYYIYDKYEGFLQRKLKKYGFDMKERESQEHLV